MAPLTQDRNTEYSLGDLLAIPVAGETRIFAGSLVCSNGSGYAVPASDARIEPPRETRTPSKADSSPKDQVRDTAPLSGENEHARLSIELMKAVTWQLAAADVRFLLSTPLTL